MSDVFGKALLDYQYGDRSGAIKTFSSLDEVDTMSLPYLFREYADMPVLEQKALQYCRGKILDIGCGAGSHSLYLQDQGYDVTALDSSPGAITTCRARGIQKTVHKTILDFSGNTFDTLLLLMNGIGIVGKLAYLPIYLGHFKKLLKEGGQLLVDSTDIIYMFDGDAEGGYNVPLNSEYYGQVEFMMEYKGERSTPFPWLYLDFHTLQRAAAAHGLRCELIGTGEHYDYLARLMVF